MDSNILILVVIGIIAVLLVVSLIKKAVKLALTLIGILVLVSLFNVFVKGTSPMEEFNGYKTDIQYSKKIADLTLKITSSSSSIKTIVEAKKLDENSIKILREENTKLHQYQKEAQGLKHSKKLDFVHNRYCDYVDTIVAVSDSTIKTINAGNKTIQGAEEITNRLKDGLDKLTELKIK